jgi:hypothetical protein
MTAAVSKIVALAALVGVALLLPACLSNRVQTLAPNMLRLDLTGVDANSDEKVLQQLLALGAQETLSRGYTHFRFIDWTPGATQIVQPGQPLKANFAVTMVMFHDGEQGQNPVFDARQFVAAR